MARPRVYELARELGVEAAVVRRELAAMGHPTASAAALVEPPVALEVRRRLVTSLPGERPADQMSELLRRWLSPEPPPRPRRRRPPTMLPDDELEDVFFDDDSLVSGPEAARWCRVKPATIRQWVSRGHLAAVNRSAGRNIYRTGDVRRVYEDVIARQLAVKASQVPLVSKDFDRLITGREASELFGVAPSTVREWVRRGHLTPAQAATRPYSYKLGDILRLVRRGERRPSPSSRSDWW